MKLFVSSDMQEVVSIIVVLSPALPEHQALHLHALHNDCISRLE